MQKLFPLLFCLGLSVSFISISGEDEHHHDHSAGLDAHVHGEAELLLAYETNQLQIILRSPAGNLLGFEHRAETAEQKQTVESARAALLEPGTLFSIKGATCDATDISVDMSAVESAHDHDHDHDHHHESEEEHAEILAEYDFSCNSEHITGMSVPLLTAFPGIETLHVQWVTETQQGLAELDPENLELELAD